MSRGVYLGGIMAGVCCYLSSQLSGAFYIPQHKCTYVSNLHLFTYQWYFFTHCTHASELDIIVYTGV